MDVIETSKLPKAKSYFENSDTGTMVSTWTTHNHIHSMLGSYVSLLSNGQCSLSGILLYRLLHSVQILPSLASDSQKLAVIMRAQHWEMCRSLMVVFNWCRDAGSSTADSVLDIHRAKGYDELKKQSPVLADLVDHIVWFVYREQSTWLKDKKEKRSQSRRKGIKSSPIVAKPEEPMGICSKFGTCPPNPKELPHDLYGLRQDQPSRRAVKLAPLSTFSGGEDELYAKSKQVLQQLWTTELIVPSLRPIDATFSSTRRRTTDDDEVLNRCLTRGAILQCVADACGTDAIFASTATKEFLTSPALMFETRLQRDKVFATRAVQDAVETLKPLFNWLTARIEETPEILETAKEIGNLTHLSMLELGTGQPILLERMQSGAQPLLSNPTPRTLRHKQSRIFSEVSLASLLPKRPTAGVGVLGLIVREALAARRSLPTTDETLRRVLQGKHATRSSAAHHNPDHTDPIRQYSLGAQLLYRHLPGEKLTTEAGLSNLLSWLGTGQGFVTESFLKTVEPHGGFYAADVEGMVNQFQRAVSTNWYHEPGSTEKSKSTSQPRKGPNFIVTHDAQIWGQASNHLALTPTHHAGAQRGSKYTLHEKFNQYFTPVVQERWKRALGDMLHQDPMTYHGSRQAWGYYHSMVKELNIPGFQQGLTVFQLANYLVFLGIATMPHWSEVADFISENRQKGAFRGLEKLGFHMPDASSVRAAFYCVHHYLDEHLTDEDKKDLGFSPIFTENLLCKVVRWAKYLSNEGKIDFYDKGLQAESAYPDWEGGLNMTDNAAFPFPLTISSEQLARAIKEAGSSVSASYNLHISDAYCTTDASCMIILVTR
jgi:hypothetical protein